MKKNNASKGINTSLIKESLVDYNNLAKELKESTPDLVRDILAEQVKQAYVNILNESDDDDIDDEDTNNEGVEDTVADTGTTGTTDIDDDATGDGEGKDTDDDVPEIETTEISVETSPEGNDSEDADDELGQEFSKYKVDGSENTYNLCDEKDDAIIVKAYKQLKDSDGVTVVKDDNQIQLSDDNTGVEYIITLDSNEAPCNVITDDDNNKTEDMNESRIFEIALNEYDSHVGYDANIGQRKTAMTTPDNYEVSKYGHSADNGVPTGTERPWGKGKKNMTPFDDDINECGDFEAPEIEEGAGNQRGANAHGTVKNHRPNTSYADRPYKPHHQSVAGVYQESIMRKANKIFQENQDLKAKLNNFTKVLQEAAVTNVNLGGIVKLISEHSTSKDEKNEIINRFMNEAHTVQQSQSLYKSIAKELTKKPHATVNINEEKRFANTEAETINESKFYQDESLMNSLGLMHKICK